MFIMDLMKGCTLNDLLIHLDRIEQVYNLSFCNILLTFQA